MRSIRINGKTYKLRPFKRGEIKKLSETYGKVGYFDQGLTVENHDELIDKYFELQNIPQSELDEMAIPDIHKLFLAVVSETWGAKIEEKNSDPSGDGSQTGNA